MIKEFQEFINKGNVVDLAVAVVIGAAFGELVKALVKDLITPIISLATKNSGVNFDAYQAGPFLIGHFINTIFSFLIIAFAVFLIVKAVNHARTRLGMGATPADFNTQILAHNAKLEAQNEQLIALMEARG